MGYMSGPAAILLKKLRDQAGYSVQEMADIVGKPKSSYQHYEDGYKKHFMALDIMKHAGPALRSRGISELDIFELEHGTRPADAASVEIEHTVLANNLPVAQLSLDPALLDEALAHAAVELGIQISPEQLADLSEVAYLMYEDVREQEAADDTLARDQAIKNAAGTVVRLHRRQKALNSKARPGESTRSNRA